MPGPKMGPRPRDFDEELVRRSPTFCKWECLAAGKKLRYACRDFLKGHGDDEERLMRRIMIARRNNVRDHETLKLARRFQPSSTSTPSLSQPSENPTGNNQKTAITHHKQQEENDVVNAEPAIGVASNKGKEEEKMNDNTNNTNTTSNNDNNRGETSEEITSRTPGALLQEQQEEQPQRWKRRPTTLISDEVIRMEIDVDAVIATRSYRAWMKLPDGAEFIYNQKYVKGEKDQDWLLQKNIWRRMRYRRENKKIVMDMIAQEREGNSPSMKQQYPAIQQQQPRSQQLSGRKRQYNDARVAYAGGCDNIPTNTTTAMMMMINETTANQQEASASTASEIVDHALSSTNTTTGIVAPTTGDDNNNVTISSMIGDHHLAAAAAASIAMVGAGVDGNDEEHTHAIEAAVAAAESYAKSNSASYHRMQGDVTNSNINSSQSVVVNNLVGNNCNPLVGISSLATTTTTGTTMATTATPWDEKALDAAARLAAAAAIAEIHPVVGLANDGTSAAAVAAAVVNTTAVATNNNNRSNNNANSGESDDGSLIEV